MQLKIAWNELRGQQHDLVANGNKPHYKLDCNIDGVAVFKCSEQGEVIPILCCIHSISKSAKPEDRKTEIILETRFPFVLGFFHGQTKPEPEDLVDEFLAELEYLNPENNAPETATRKFTVRLHCMKCDTPIRYEKN